MNNRYSQSDNKPGILSGEINRMKKLVSLLESLQNGNEEAKPELLRMARNVAHDGPMITMRLDDLFETE